MKTWKKIRASSLLAILFLPALLPAQWARYGNCGQPHSVLEASGGGWVIASGGNIFELSPEGTVVWGQKFDSDPYSTLCRRAWFAPDGGIVAAVDSSFGGAATLFKLSASGSLVWEKIYSLADASLDIFAPASDGGAFLAGSLVLDVLVCRVSAEGEIVWARVLGTAEAEQASAAAPTADGGAIVLGTCSSGDYGATSDLWVLKLASTGEVEWQKRIGGAESDGADSVVQTADGGYLVAGYTATFDADRQFRPWLLKISAAGAVQRQSTLEHEGPGNFGLRSVGGDLFAAAVPSSFQTDTRRVVVVTVAGDGTVVREKPYSSGLASFDGVDLVTTDDGGFLLSLMGNPTADDASSDSHILKILPSGEIGWQKYYGSRYAPDAVTAIGPAGDGGHILAGTTRSWGSILEALSFTWIMRTAADGSIGPTYTFVRPASGAAGADLTTWKNVAATVTDTTAQPQVTGLVAGAGNVPFAAWGPSELPALGQPTCTLWAHASTGGSVKAAPGGYSYDTGTEVRLEAVPAAKYEFGEWVGNIVLNRPAATIVMDGDKQIWANFYYVGEGIEKIINEMTECFVATAAYGDPSHPDVEVLRRFRDRYLMKSRAGRAFVSLYYRYSPPVAKFVAECPGLRALSRAILSPIVALIKWGT